MEVAARYLGARPRTRWELERRLKRTGAEEAVVERTLERLTALGYVDDRAFARWWAEQRDRHSPRGRRMVEAELRQHGVPREVIEELRGGELAEPALAAAVARRAEQRRERLVREPDLEPRVDVGHGHGHDVEDRLGDFGSHCVASAYGQARVPRSRGIVAAQSWAENRRRPALTRARARPGSRAGNGR